ncbi:glycosyltransferase [Exiguobacterium sp. SL14]|nr:glycosyltransferase [Exiguobacterium sp. SL14]MCY1689906.1 glycosyltransferase [Exiguobacterium sp. SL14]
MYDFSIIIPVYNTQKYLDRCLQTVINQTYENIEIVIINDGSSDGSLNKCLEYAEKDSRIVLISQENMGLSVARNKGIEVAKGKYIIFLDSDDYIDYKTCEVFLEILKSNSYPEVIIGDYQEKIDDDSKNIYSSVELDCNKLEISKETDGVEFLKSKLKKKTITMAACFNIYSKEFLKINNLYFKNGLLHEDELWTPQVLLKTGRLVTVKYKFYNYIIRDNSITKQKNKKKNALDLIEIIKELKPIYREIEDQKLKKLLNDYLVVLYLNAFFIGALYKNEDAHLLNSTFPLKNAHFMKNKIKSILFLINRKLYYMINKKIKES